jgi:DNA-binding NarL/FixJ family response regulator
MERPIHVLLVEDNDVFRESLVFLLDRRDDVTVVGAIAEGGAAAATCAELRVDVAVIDYRLPDLDGAEVAQEVFDLCPAASVVFLSASAGAQELEAARIAGVQLVRKDEGIEALVEALRSAVGKEKP